MRTRSSLLGLLVVTALFAAPPSVQAQAGSPFAAACVAEGGTSAVCGRAAVAAEWLTSSAGLLAGAVSMTPDLYRTLGFRTDGGTPRSAIDFRIGFASTRHPSLASPTTTDAIERTQLALGLGGELAVFDGFQPYPTLGGVLSADLLAGYTWIPWSESVGYDRASNYRTVGVRMGLMRESFSVPGIALTVSRSWGSTLIYEGDPGIASVNPGLTALRLAVGKDVFGVGVHAALGRNWADSDARIGGDFGAGQIFAEAELDHSRTTAQVGASLNFLVVRVEADLGWGLGSGGPAIDGFAAEGGALFGALAVRLIL